MKKSVLLSLLVGILFLTGCGMSELEKAQAEYFCKDRGGVYNETTFFSYVYCNNGAKEKFSNIEIEDEDYFARPEKEDDK